MNKFICIEGIDGAGKTTQAKLLAERLGDRAILVHEPGTTRLGLMIRALLKNPENTDMAATTEVLLFNAARAQLMQEIVHPALDQGKIVITDRFLPSTVAYQQGFRIQELNEIGKFATKGTLPDIVLLLNLPVEEGFKRKMIREDRIEQRDKEYHWRVWNRYRQQASMDESFTIVDARPPIEAIHHTICGILKAKGMV